MIIVGIFTRTAHLSVGVKEFKTEMRTSLGSKYTYIRYKHTRIESDFYGLI